MTNAAFNNAVETVRRLSHSDFRFSVNFKEFTEKLHWIRPNWQVRENQLAEYFWPKAQPETLAKDSTDIARFDAAEYWGILDSFYTPDIEDLSPEQRTDLLRLYKAKRPGQINAVTYLQFVCNHIAEIGLGKTNFFWATLIDLVVYYKYDYQKALKIVRFIQTNNLGKIYKDYSIEKMVERILDYGLESVFKNMVKAADPLGFDQVVRWFTDEEDFKDLLKMSTNPNPFRAGVKVKSYKLVLMRAFTKTKLQDSWWELKELAAIYDYRTGKVDLNTLLSIFKSCWWWDNARGGSRWEDLVCLVLNDGQKPFMFSYGNRVNSYVADIIRNFPEKIPALREWGYLDLELFEKVVLEGKAGMFVKRIAGGLGISKAEATKLLKQNKRCPKDFLDNDEGYCHLHRLSSSWMGARWWQAKKDSPIWDKVQRAYGPNGQVFEYTYRRLLDEIEEEDLIDGWKTSPEKAIKHAAERRQATVEGMLGCDFTPLPECPLKGNETFKQATTPAELVAKGKYFSNCVASYAAACKEKSAYIFTSEDICAEINPPNEDHQDWYARQVLSFNNSLPSEESRTKFYAWFNEAVKEYKKKGKEK